MIPKAPLFPVPHLVERPWGGASLARWNRELAGCPRVGESWDLGCFAGFDSRLEDSPFSTLSQAAAHDQGSWLGCAEARFPLLVKLIDARETLSVQVHPSCPAPGIDPKNECWVVLEAPPGAKLWAGTSRPLPPSELVAALQTGDLSALRAIPVAPGDVVMIPAGTIHAITAGLLVAEIQQASDTTFRVHDWGRMGLDGRPRALHVAESLASLDTAERDLKPAPLPLAPRRELLCATPWFLLERLRGRFPLPALPGFRILQVLEGPGALRWADGSRELPQGGLVLLPCGLEAEVEAPILLSTVVPSREMLEAMGLSDLDLAPLSAGTLPERS